MEHPSFVSEETFQVKMKALFANDNSWARTENVAAFAAWTGQFVSTVQRWINGSSVPSRYIRDAVLNDAETFFAEPA
jgi:hypothetical protein